jgi:choloylglycine hydrolase
MIMTHRVFGRLYLIALFLWQITVTSASACTDFLIKTGDGAVIVGRSLEWGSDLESKVKLHPRGEQISSSAPGEQTGLSWKSKHGYVGLNINVRDAVLDGINEKGLSIGGLWLPGSVYQEVSPSQASRALSVTDLGSWILGNFATISEVVPALSQIRVWCPQLTGGKIALHFALHDASGESLVIEFVNGEQKIYHNPVGVLTNAPTFDWHIANLNNYLHLSPSDPQPITIQGAVLSPPGLGGGFLGIPGDWTPPSRFVRTNAMLSFAQPARNAEGGVSLAQHILNAVDIPLGDTRGKMQQDGTYYSDYTQWVVIKDLTDKIFYFRSYNNLTLRAIDLKRLDFAAGAPAKWISIEGGAPATDATLLLK